MTQKPFEFAFFLKHRIGMHVLFWLVVLAYFTFGYGKAGAYGKEMIRSLAFLPQHAFLVYTFLYFLIPRFLLRRKFVAFGALAVLSVGIAIAFSYVANFQILASIGLGSDFRTTWNPGLALLGQFTILGTAVSIKLLKYWYRQKKEIMEAQQQRLSAELQLLKSQVHPHFLFNTLNNLYSLTLHQSSRAPEIVLKLSQLLRFMIYESKTSEIPVSREIEMLKDYIELEKLRYGNRLDISLSFTGDIEDKFLPPLLLLPLVENSFKHGTSKQLDQCWISLDMHVLEDTLQVKIVNSKDADRQDAATTHKGLGLQNVKRRLELLYPGRHHLQISAHDDMFLVQLQVELNRRQRTPEYSDFTEPASYEMEMLTGR